MKMGKLDESYQRSLEKLGISWDPYADQFEQNFALLGHFKERHTMVIFSFVRDYFAFTTLARATMDKQSTFVHSLIQFMFRYGKPHGCPTNRSTDALPQSWHGTEAVGSPSQDFPIPCTA